MISSSSVVARSPAMLSAEIDGETIIMSIDNACYFSLNEIGGKIWTLIETPCAFGDRIDRLAHEFDAEAGQIESDAKAFLEQMVFRRVITIS
jgi:hypothetical protein